MTETNPSSMGEMNREIARKCAALGLSIDCGADGSFLSEIAVVGEAPGERERIMKLPLVGQSGKYLWDNLRSIGINRRNVYISNTVKRQLRSALSGGDEKAGISRNEIDHHASILRWELQQLPNLKYVICLGNYALEAVTGLTGIMQHRGSVYDSQIASVLGDTKRVQVVAFLNPAAVLREPKWELMFKFDVGRLKTVLEGKYVPHEITEHINPSFTEAMQWIEKLQDEKIATALDIEVIANETACIGFANNSHEGYCINFRDRDRNRYSVNEEVQIRKRIQQFADDPDTKWVMQNGMFDSYWLAYKDRIMLGRSYFDTMLAHHTLYPTLPHNLGFLTSQYTNHPFYKDDGKSWKEGGDINTFWRYNVKDCCITLAVYLRELQELRSQHLDKFFFDHVMRLQPHLIRMTVGGIKVDRPLKETIAAELQQEVAKLKDKFYQHVEAATGDPEYKPNPKSSKQMSELFFRRLRLVGRGVATDEKNRRRMLEHPRTPPAAREMILTLNQWAKENKFLTTYAEMEIDPDDRARSEYKQTGVQSAPGRLSSTSVMWGSGTNLQNQPGRAHRMFIADEGYEFSYFDLSQAEARVVGWKAGIQQWMDDFERAREDGIFDAHRSLASTMFDIPYDDVPKEDWNEDGTPTKRYIAKRCLPPSVNVLTKRGWISIAEACETKEAIAVWNADDEMHWEVPSSWFAEETKEPLVNFDGEFVKLLATKDHRMPVYNNGQLGERPAGDFLEKSYGAMPINGFLDEGVSYAYPRIWAMCWADGTIEANYPNSVRVSVRKQRKADRLRWLCQEAGLDYWENYNWKSDMYHFRIYGYREKALSWDMLGWDLETRLEFLDELKFWDGHPETGRIFNTKLDDMRIIQALAHISGKRAAIFNHGVPRETEQQCYMLRPTDNAKAYYSSMTISEEDYEGMVYCPTVSTGAFLVQYKDRACITFNCRHGLNYRMMADRLAETAYLTPRQADEAFKLYHRINPELSAWWQWTEDQVRTHRQLYNVYGRRWILLERLDEEALKSIVAFYPQSTIGDKVSRCIYLCESDPDWPETARMVLNIHDALVALNRFEDGPRVRAIMKKYAEEPLMIEDINGVTRELIIPCDLKRSVPDEQGVHRWSTLEKIK